MNKLLTILIGIIFLAAPILAWGSNWAGFGEAALLFLQGGIMWVLMGIGLILIILALVEIKG